MATMPIRTNVNKHLGGSMNESKISEQINKIQRVIISAKLKLALIKRADKENHVMADVIRSAIEQYLDDLPFKESVKPELLDNNEFALLFSVSYELESKIIDAIVKIKQSDPKFNKSKLVRTALTNYLFN